MTRKWNYVPLTSEEEQIAQELAAGPIDCRAVNELLIERGITSLEDAKRFFYPSLSDLLDPFLMNGMDAAVSRLNKALGKKERIMVYGDYDVDGITAVALVYKYLQNYYSNLEYYIPTRYEEGYGISLKSIEYAKSNDVKLIIVLDCGIKAVEEIKYAKELGIDFIICDHHVPDNELPPAVAILNPKMPDNTYPYPHLSGCGVGFKLMQAFALSNGLDSSNELESLLDLVAVSIAADIVPITGENRILAHYGLKRLNHNPNLGLRAIIKICNLVHKEITISDVVFKIGPRINASGRMQSGMEAVELLVTRDAAEALSLAKNIDQYNQDRKELDKRITEEANNIITDGGADLSKNKSIVIYNKNWHKGIIGIVASRLTELYYKPSVVLTYSDGIATGSSRSVQGFDVYKAVENARDLLENFGGHTYAVGLSLKEENIPEFTRRFEEYVKANIEPTQLTPTVTIDSILQFAEITPAFLQYLKLFNPFGAGNPVPVFFTKRVHDYGTSKLVGRKLEHIKLEIVDDSCGNVMNGIAFNMSKYFNRIKAGEAFDICYTIEENKHRGNSMVQLQIKEIQMANN
ncbi:MAG: single-stranded-DNA-specific exonuclease RecJ [Muribaculaceae bacterium]|nr:single-stranded-DNA-specific exonuclease RecJ [Muribaculaceae bacterium]